MTPQLQQAIKLLQLGRLEYIEAIEKELLENPVLEISGDDENIGAAPTTDPQPTSEIDSALQSHSSISDEISEVPPAQKESGTESPIDWADYLENFSDARGAAPQKGLINFDDRPSLENTLSKSENLVEHILLQLRMSDMSPDDENIAASIVGNLDKDGYLCATFEEISKDCQCTLAAVEEVHKRILYLDPPGVAARNLGECLLIQLEHLGFGDSLAARIIEQHIDKLEKRAFDKIAKAEQVPVEEIYSAVQLIQKLEPRPGRQFGDDETRYIVPDIYVHKIGSEYVITLNEDGLPKLRISPYYLKLLEKDAESSSDNKAYLNDRLKAASWLIKSIHQRQKTIYRVTESIVKFQREFFECGISKLKPMVLKDVADDIGMHESTVSRVTTNKYVHTTHGVFELKFFFTSGIKAGGEDVSSSMVKDRIKTIIAAEDPGNPISDQQIVETLKLEKIEIARRTVAKYRETLGILSSAKRKRLF